MSAQATEMPACRVAAGKGNRKPYPGPDETPQCTLVAADLPLITEKLGRLIPWRTPQNGSSITIAPIPVGAERRNLRNKDSFFIQGSLTGEKNKNLLAFSATGRTLLSAVYLKSESAPLHGWC